MEQNIQQKEAIQNFGDMVNATERMSAPWQEECKRWQDECARMKDLAEKKQKHHTVQLLAISFFWMIIVAMLIWFAYMTPIDASQEQDFAEQTQNQSYSEGVTDGE